jgi:hypothetical protein
MTNFVYIYFNDGQPNTKSMDELNAAWMKWFGELGDKIVDSGNPFNTGSKTVKKSGVESIPSGNGPTGYSIVKAADLAEAIKMSQGCPVLEDVGGAVHVFETLPM